MQKKLWSYLLIALGIACLGLTVGCGEPPLLQIRLNEILTKSTTGDDWIELYNPTDQELPLFGLQLLDSNSGKVWSFPEGTVIAAKGYLQVICDDSDKDGNTSFKLSSKGETITLRTAAAEEIDKVTYPAQTEDVSWGRSPDGSGEWKAMSSLTPGKANP